MREGGPFDPTEEQDLAESRGAASVHDVAEATGLSDEDVAAHLRQLRAETAFAEPRPPQPSALPWIAAGALAVGLGVTYWRLHPDVSLPRAIPASFAPPSTAPISTRSVQTTNLTIMSDTDGAPKAPPGFRVETIGQTSDHMSDGVMGETPPRPYEEVRDALVASAEALVQATDRAEDGATAPAGTRYSGMGGGIFSPRKGFVHLSMFGWAGTETDWIAVPLTDVGRERIRGLAERLLADAKREQEEALAPVPDPSSGIVRPPPAFSLRFAGRRLDLQQGPHVSFAPISSASVAARLEAEILNAVARDRRPPVGAWSGSIGADAKIPLPAVSRAEIMGPDGVVTGDIPTAMDDSAATRRAAHALAQKASVQIETTNRKARGTTDGR